jgi:hypothetical protein
MDDQIFWETKERRLLDLRRGPATERPDGRTSGSEHYREPVGKSA